MAAKAEKAIKFKIPEAVISFDPALCTGCGTCQLMCTLYHEGVGGPALSRCRLDRDPFNGRFIFSVCKQCLAPSCYLACPLPDLSMCIDEETGVRFINEDECLGCKKCQKACPFDPAEIGFNPEKKKSYKCDLCRGRAEGPLCVEYCPVGALQMVPTKKREKRK